MMIHQMKIGEKGIRDRRQLLAKWTVLIQNVITSKREKNEIGVLTERGQIKGKKRKEEQIIDPRKMVISIKD